MLDKLGDGEGWRIADKQVDVVGGLGVVRFIFGAETDQLRPLGDTDSAMMEASFSALPRSIDGARCRVTKTRCA